MTVFPFVFFCLFAAAYGHGTYPHKPPVYDYKPAPSAYKPYDYKPAYKPYDYKPDYKPAVPAKLKIVPIPLPFPSPSKPVRVAVQVSNVQDAGRPGQNNQNNKNKIKKGGLLGGLKGLPNPFSRDQEFIGNLLETPRPIPVVTPPAPKPFLLPVYPAPLPPYPNKYGGDVYGEPKSEAVSAASDLGDFADFIKPLLSAL